VSLSFSQYHTISLILHLIVLALFILYMKYLAESAGHSHQDLFG